MAYTKGDAVYDALEMIGVVDGITSPDPAEIGSGLRILERLAAELDALGLCFGYQYTPEGEPTDPGDEIGVPDGARNLYITKLAIRLCGILGREAPSHLYTQEASATNAALCLLDVAQPDPANAPLGTANGNNEFYKADGFLIIGGNKVITH